MAGMQPSIQPLLPDPVIVDVVDVRVHSAGPARTPPPPYHILEEEGRARVVRVAPDADAVTRVNSAARPAKQCVRCTVGDGTERDFHVCAAEEMSSLLKPEPKRLAYFHGLLERAQVVRIERVQTRRLDDLAEIGSPDLLKIDVRGAELDVLASASGVLGEAVVIHTAVWFVPIYQGQALFGDVDELLRRHGYMLHRFARLASRTLSPLIVNDDVDAGLSQAFAGEAVYIRDFMRFGELPAPKLLKLAVILNDMYGSLDVAYEALATYDQRTGTRTGEEFLSRLAGSTT